MMRRSYKTDTRRINEGSKAPRSLGFWSIVCLLGALACGLAAPARRGHAQAANDGADVLALVVAHARAHPAARGPVVLTRHERVYDRTTREVGSLALDATGALVTMGSDADLRVLPDLIEAFDGSERPGLLLVLRGETPLARYAALLGGEDPATHFASRVLRRDATRATIELLPRVAWLGLERMVAQVIVTGPDRGRVERVLWLDGLGNWQRLELERLSYPARLDPSALVAPEHRGARRVEL